MSGVEHKVTKMELLQIYCLLHYLQSSQKCMFNGEIPNLELRFFMLRQTLSVQCLKDSFIYLGCFPSNKRIKITWAYVRSLKDPLSLVRFLKLCWVPPPPFSAYVVFEWPRIEVMSMYMSYSALTHCNFL